MLQGRIRLPCNMEVAVRGRKAWAHGQYFIWVSHGFFIPSCSAGDKRCSERWSWLISVGCHNDISNRDVNPNMPYVHAVVKTTGLTVFGYLQPKKHITSRMQDTRPIIESVEFKLIDCQWWSVLLGVWNKFHEKRPIIFRKPDSTLYLWT